MRHDANEGITTDGPRRTAHECEKAPDAVDAALHLILAVSVAVLLVAGVAVPAASAHNATFGSQHNLTASAGAGDDAARSNAVTLPPDGDADGVRDGNDNCASDANPDQRDGDGDGQGDACDPDADGEGYTAAANDCADDDASRHPGAPENIQNGIDDDCDGSVDEALPGDLDGDGDGYTPSDGDCDDIHPRVNPAQPEIDDGIDNDCNGAVDEGFDADGDGYTPRAGDCNDNDAQIHPATDDPGNGVDDNCDGIVDGTAPAHTCWVPSSEPITAAVTWSQVETMEPCIWTLDTYSGYWLGLAFMVSAAWWVEYTPAFDVSAVAFRYWEMDWTFVAIRPTP